MLAFAGAQTYAEAAWLIPRLGGEYRYLYPAISQTYPPLGSEVRTIGYGGDQCHESGVNPAGLGTKRRAKSRVETLEHQPHSFNLVGVHVCDGDSGGAVFTVDPTGNELDIIGTVTGPWLYREQGYGNWGTQFADAVKYKETLRQTAQAVDTANGTPPALESIHKPLP